MDRHWTELILLLGCLLMAPWAVAAHATDKHTNVPGQPGPDGRDARTGTTG